MRSWSDGDLVPTKTLSVLSAKVLASDPCCRSVYRGQKRDSNLQLAESPKILPPLEHRNPPSPVFNASLDLDGTLA